MIIQILILVMLWLFTCAVCAVSGFIYGRNAKTKRNYSESGTEQAESEETKRLKKELANFYKYNGTEQE